MMMMMLTMMLLVVVIIVMMVKMTFYDHGTAVYKDHSLCFVYPGRLAARTITLLAGKT